MKTQKKKNLTQTDLKKKFLHNQFFLMNAVERFRCNRVHIFAALALYMSGIYQYKVTRSQKRTSDRIPPFAYRRHQSKVQKLWRKEFNFDIRNRTKTNH